MLNQIKITGPIILIDDDEDDHEVLTIICKRIGVGSDLLRHFTKGAEFLTYLRSAPDAPFIIFCDINMPGMSGLDLRSELNKDEELRKKSIPFIFFSTAATNAQVKKAYDLTVQGFFLKGSTIFEIEERIRRILEYWSDCKHPNSD